MAHSALLDANVLHPQILCDLLLRLAEHDGFRPLWSARILEETIESILRRRPDLDRTRLQRRLDAMSEAFPDACVTGYEQLIPTMPEMGAELVRDGGIAELLMIVGDGRDRSALEARARTLGIGARVVFAGYTANPLPHVARARLLVLSSKYEGLPMVLIEGLMLGQVMISSDCPTGPREILDGGRAGLLVPVGDPSALASAMRRALQDGALRATLSARAAEHAATFDVPAFRKRFDDLIARL